MTVAIEVGLKSSSRRVGRRFAECGQMTSLSVLYEDNHLLILEKPPGVLAQGDETGDATLFEQAKDYVKEKYDKPGAVYLGMVHRLDRPTGGVIMYCRTSKAAARMSTQFRDREVKKTYLAACQGRAEQLEGTLKNFLGFDKKKRKARVFLSARDGSKEAVLKYKVIAQIGFKSLLEVEPTTGRKHQIRAQLAHAGLPILGDQKYAPEAADGGFVKNIGLWAYKLKFSHPVGGEEITVVSLPKWKKYQLWQVFSDKIDSL